MVVRYAEDMNDTFTTVVAKRQIDPEGVSEKDGSNNRLWRNKLILIQNIIWRFIRLSICLRLKEAHVLNITFNKFRLNKLWNLVISFIP